MGMNGASGIHVVVVNKLDRLKQIAAAEENEKFAMVESILKTWECSAPGTAPSWGE
jgi:hypothetical protein